MNRMKIEDWNLKIGNWTAGGEPGETWIKREIREIPEPPVTVMARSELGGQLSNKRYSFNSAAAV